MPPTTTLVDLLEAGVCEEEKEEEDEEEGEEEEEEEEEQDKLDFEKMLDYLGNY